MKIDTQLTPEQKKEVLLLADRFSEGISCLAGVLEDGAVRVRIPFGPHNWYIDIDRWGVWTEIRSKPVEAPSFMSIF